ncbi:carboxymuconolactone decarboxylase family protein [Spiractinospora alimapuensis]|uniref:carboxymuconolactone decarboxylase family protein n=1 Tax=Spiractinospora alimapuensis TaxID=2820884 RepID=UPI001F333641|nr:carboxymuconolactone decarboxylase family protein [Spiractinospora alimapuensis]QVQ54556.1 carboxymuconolactone decarboxylase family protein [Spiractinospora alimapuensis]
MPRMTALEPSEAPARSAELLSGIIARNGQVGPMVATMANSPALLNGYLELSRSMKRAKLPRALSEKVSLALQEWIGCALCLSAHTAAGKAAGLSDNDVALARQGVSTDPRETALISFAVRVLAEPSSFADDDISTLRAHGWDERAIADVVGLVALNLMTGAFNLVAGLEPDDARGREDAA